MNETLCQTLWVALFAIGPFGLVSIVSAFVYAETQQEKVDPMLDWIMPLNIVVNSGLYALMIEGLLFH